MTTRWECAYSVGFVHVDDDCGARTGETFLRRDEIEVLFRPVLIDGAGPEEPHDARRPLERTEHNRDPPVLSQVRDGLHACHKRSECKWTEEVRQEEHGRTTSTEVFVPHPRLALDVQRPPQPFGGEVDVSGPAERSASNKEHLLLLDPRNELVRYVVVELAHPG